MRYYLLDGDMLLYEALLSVTVDFEFQGEVLGPFVHRESLLGSVAATTASWLEQAGARAGDETILCMSTPRELGWRRRLWPEYKSHRVGGKPMGWSRAAGWLVQNHRVWTEAGLEADDLMAIGATGPYHGRSVVVSGDKDLDQAPGLHFNPLKPERGVYVVTPAQGEFLHLRQALEGDRSDHYPGCPGLGPVKVGRLLAPFDPDPLEEGEWDPEAAWAAAWGAFMAAGQTEDFARTQFAVSRILRAEEWEAGVPVPWLGPAV